MNHRTVLLFLAAIVLASTAFAQAPAPGAYLEDAIWIDGYEFPDNCKFYAERYGFAVTDTRKCAMHHNSDVHAVVRLLELRAPAVPASYCGVHDEFADAVGLKYWAGKDGGYRLRLLKTTSAELDNLAFRKAVALGQLIAKRFQSGKYDDTNCPVWLNPDNYVFRRHPSVSATEFGFIYGDLDEVLYFFKSTNRLPPPGVPTVEEREAAEQRFDRTHPIK